MDTVGCAGDNLFVFGSASLQCEPRGKRNEAQPGATADLLGSGPLMCASVSQLIKPWLSLCP